MQMPRSNHQLAFIGALHLEIVIAIFSFLNQRDVLTCMAVCRDWYYTIPQYTQDQWKRIKLGSQDLRKPNRRKIHCLGDHVTRVTLDKMENEQDVYHILHKLFDWGCTQIKFLEFNQCQSEDQDAFLDALTKLAPHLTHLSMLNHLSNIAFLYVFKACPELTHFIFEIQMSTSWKFEMYYEEPEVSYADEPLNLTTKITHLCLNVVLESSPRVHPILRSCPNLRCYVGPSKDATTIIQMPNWDRRYKTLSIDLDHLFDACPKVNHVQPFHTSYEFEKLEAFDKYTSNPTVTGLRTLMVCEEYGADRIAEYLTKSRDTLENLSLEVFGHDEDEDDMIDWSPVFRSLQLRQLRVLTLGYIHFDTASLVTMLNGTPILESLELDCENHVFNPVSLQSLCTLFQLRSFKCHSLCVNDIGFEMLLARFPNLEKLNLTLSNISLTVPRYMGYSAKQLKCLTLRNADWNTRPNNETVPTEDAVSRFLHYWTARSKIEVIQMGFVKLLGRKALFSLADDIPTLKVLDLRITEFMRLKENDWFLFATKLHGTAIEILSVSGMESASIRLLNVLGELPLLKALHLPSFDSYKVVCSINVEGLLQMLRKSVSLATVSYDRALLDKSLQGVRDEDNLSTLINKTVPRYYVESEGKSSKLHMSFTLYHATIKRRV